jgi:hypothetical protein
MLQWYAGNWEHRAYWGGNSLNYGINATPSRRYMGPLPPAGQWVQLKIPASQVSLEGTAITGMAFTLYGGRATWDSAGRLSTLSGVQSSGPRFNSIALARGEATLQWNSTANHTYRVSYKNNLSDSSWTALADVVASASTTSWTDSNAWQSRQRFYILTQLD